MRRGIARVSLYDITTDTIFSLSSLFGESVFESHAIASDVVGGDCDSTRASRVRANEGRASTLGRSIGRSSRREVAVRIKGKQGMSGTGSLQGRWVWKTGTDLDTESVTSVVARSVLSLVNVPGGWRRQRWSAS